MKNKKNIFAIVLFVFSVAPLVAYAQWDVSRYSGYGLPEESIWTIIYSLMFWLLSLISIVAVIAFLISGIQYLVSAGNEKVIESAKRHMIWSVVGVLVALSGLIILRAATWWLNGYSTF